MTREVITSRSENKNLLNWLNSHGKNKSNFIEKTLNQVRTGELLPAQDVIDEKELDQKIKEQQYLKLCLQNWKELKSSGHIMEEAKAIILGEKELEAPQLQSLIQVQQQGLDQFGGCFTCHHRHTKSAPRVCMEHGCNCGVRG